MSNLRSHKTKIIRGKRIILNSNQLQKGMIVEARYAPQKDGKPGQSKNYMLLILNPSYKGKSKVAKVHALTLDNFTPMILNSLAEKVGLLYIPRYEKMVGMSIPKLLMDEASQRFYNSKLKKDMAGKYGASYRTLFEKSFKGMELVNYNFDKKVLYKFFPKEEVDEE
tara:strand:+ start:2987 stop:3487 length:501 start_codon:yes stop_codon:yes gene_type:complete